MLTIEEQLKRITTKIIKTVFFNGGSARTLTRLKYENGEVEWSIAQINLFTGKSEYFRQFSTHHEAHLAF